MTLPKNQSKTNGHAGSHGRTNGHAPASTERGGIPERRDHAASDDDSRTSVTGGAGFGAAPGTDCGAYAEAAPPHMNGNLVHADKRQPKRVVEKEAIPGGELPLPLHPGEFVEEIHRNADLFIVWKELLNSKDEKIRQRTVEKLTEMLYKGAAALADEPQRIVIDMPRPDRD